MRFRCCSRADLAVVTVLRPSLLSWAAAQTVVGDPPAAETLWRVGSKLKLKTQHLRKRQVEQPLCAGVVLRLIIGLATQYWLRPVHGGVGAALGHRQAERAMRSIVTRMRRSENRRGGQGVAEYMQYAS